MNPPQNRPVAITLRLYRVLARAFPYEFKNAYGDELVQMTEDAVESIWRQHGILGLVRLLADIAIRVPAEHFAEFSQDVRYGLRMLAGSPGFTAVALLSLGIGIGIGSSAFSFISATILRDVPAVQKPHELVSLRGRASYPNYRHYRDRSDLFSSTLAYTPAPFGISFSGPSHRIWGHLVTPSYFPALGVRPALGSAFAEEHEKPGAQPAVVVSHRFWQVHLGSDSSAIGKSVRINGQPCLLIGVAPKEFLGASPMILPADVWLPISAGERVAPELADNALDRRSAAIFQMVARLQPGVTLSRAEAELDTIAQRLEQAFGDVNRNQKGRRVLLVTGGRLVPFRPENLPMLLGFPMVLVGLMLLIACSNVANMMLARAGARRREIAVRLALGASRARLIRQLLTESMMLAGAAGALALVFAVWYMQLLSGTDVLRTALGSTYPAPVDSSLAPDVRVLLFTLALAVFTGLAFGLMPAFQATRADLTPALKNGGAVQFRKYGRWSVRNLLVLSQVAGSLTLLLLTAVLTIGYQRSLGVEVGFNPRNLHVIAVDPVRDGYSAERAVAFFGTLLERVKRLPSVTAAAVTGTQPMSAPPPSITFAAAAEPGSTRAIGNADKLVIGKDYFSTLGIPLLAGREFRREDEVSGATAVIVSERVVRESLAGSTPGDSPVGRRIEIASQTFEIVGVVANAKLYFALEEARPVIYFPMRPENYVRPSLTGVTLV
ncbi:MAG: ABC transporter permease, partial [Bryobacteraceae bacterium]